MEQNPHYTVLQKNWAKVGKHSIPDTLHLEVELLKKTMDILQVGASYYFVFVPPLGIIDFSSKSISDVLGYSQEEFTVDLFLESIHPDDFPYFMDYELAVVEFKMKLPIEKVMKYKSRYNYRIRHKNGKYLHILQQSVTIQSNDKGAALRNLVVHTDIGYLKQNNKKSLSFIGLDGEPSFLNYKVKRKFIPQTKELFTRREKQILSLLANNKSSAEIGKTLSISPETVKTHRKNINAKAGASSPLELVTLAKEKGWI